ncbi:FtsX-like permease family protein [Candidatus Woesearchaeota archaeon]|nr:FtsX-like permease family protein [Candidatus Woesearchaeota archaeon]
MKLEFFLALKELKIHKTFFIIVIALSVGAATYIYSTGVTQDMRDKVYSYSVRLDVGDMVIRPPEDRRYIENADSKVKKISMLPGVFALSPRLETTATILKGEDKEIITVFSFIPSKEVSVTGIDYYLIEGNFLSDERKDNILLGRDLAIELNADVGEKIELEFENGKKRSYNINGITLVGKYQLDRKTVMLNVDDVEEVLGVDDVASRILIGLEKGIVPEEYRPVILSQGIAGKVSTASEESLGSYTTLDLMSRVLRMMVVFTLIVAAIMESVLFYIHVLGRTRQIGLLKALGLSNNSIIMVYVIQGLAFGIIASLIGTALGFIASTYSQQYPFYLPIFNLSFGGQFKAVTVLQAILFTMIAAVLAITLPAYKAIKTTISEAMRYG